MLLKENKTGQPLVKGQKVTYTKEIMFKGTEEITTEVFAINGNKVLMLNGDVVHAI